MFILFRPSESNAATDFLSYPEKRDSALQNLFFPVSEILELTSTSKSKEQSEQLALGLRGGKNNNETILWHRPQVALSHKTGRSQPASKEFMICIVSMLMQQKRLKRAIGFLRGGMERGRGDEEQLRREQS